VQQGCDDVSRKALVRPVRCAVRHDAVGDQAVFGDGDAGIDLGMHVARVDQGELCQLARELRRQHHGLVF